MCWWCGQVSWVCEQLIALPDFPMQKEQIQKIKLRFLLARGVPFSPDLCPESRWPFNVV